MGSAAAIVFDWYNTLAMPASFWARVPELVNEAGGTATPDAFDSWERDHPIEHPEHSVSEDAYRQWQRTRLERFLEHCQVPEPSRPQVVGWVEQKRYEQLSRVFDDVADTLDALRSAGRVVGVCSNWDWDLDRHLAHNAIDDLVDFAVCSAIAGYRKPHPAIFDVVIAHAECDPAEIMFVGDSLRDDVSGASAAGLRTVHIDRDGACTVHADDDVACVADLKAVLHLVL